MPKEGRHTGSFVAVGEDGTERTVHMFTDILDAGTRADPHRELPGLRALQTEDGEAVNRVDKGKYEIVVTGEVLRSDDPDAP